MTQTLADAPEETEDACGLCEDKSDKHFKAPDEGSCGAQAMLQLANEASFDWIRARPC